MGVQKKEYMKNIVAEALFIGQYIVYFSGYITECSVHKIKKVVITDNNWTKEDVDLLTSCKFNSLTFSFWMTWEE